MQAILSVIFKGILGGTCKWLWKHTVTERRLLTLLVLAGFVLVAAFIAFDKWRQ